MCFLVTPFLLDGILAEFAFLGEQAPVYNLKSFIWFGIGHL
jgi:hypothetical protein